MTDRLYYNDPYLRAFDATITRVERRDDRWAVTLDRTAFYPTSGGQPFDTGTLGPLRAGDVIAFPAGSVGAHQVINKSDRPCRVFMLGAEDPNSVCYYPDSDKFGAYPGKSLMRGLARVMVRASPSLDYFEGE